MIIACLPFLERIFHGMPIWLPDCSWASWQYLQLSYVGLYSYVVWLLHLYIERINRMKRKTLIKSVKKSKTSKVWFDLVKEICKQRKNV